MLGPRKKIIPPLACLMARLLRYIHPHVSPRYARVDVPCRQTIIRRNRVELFLTVTLTDRMRAALESDDLGGIKSVGVQVEPGVTTPKI